ncbi:hypothetical protein SKAU_G00005740 [Synaphobranchus kaupii]|uniref:Reverse transcriptase n=1 Tax=Synaphobranchus kaupii TaxID=118154 RepID=A0A9Q1JAQ4_SYNKA|nr:hypothetical protein SKAU_G00005740 [Synaphobranchus kaupii]
MGPIHAGSEQRGEVEMKIWTVQTLPGEVQAEDLPRVEGLAPAQQHQAQELLQPTRVFTAHKEDFGCTDAVLHHTTTRLKAVVDAYLLPQIEEFLTCLERAEWYSTLDLASGYQQVVRCHRNRRLSKRMLGKLERSQRSWSIWGPPTQAL